MVGVNFFLNKKNERGGESRERTLRRTKGAEEGCIRKGLGGHFGSAPGHRVPHSVKRKKRERKLRETRERSRSSVWGRRRDRKKKSGKKREKRTGPRK